MFYRVKQDINRKWFYLWCRAILKTAPLTPQGNNLVIVSMVSHKDVLMYLIAIKSLYHHLNIGQVAILNDGSLTEKDCFTLKEHIKPIQIIDINDINFNDRVPRGNCWERLLLISNYVKNNYVIQLDSDTVTKGNIAEIIISYIKNNRSFAIGTSREQKITPMRMAYERAKKLSINFVQIIAEQNFDKLSGFAQLRYTNCSASFTGFARGSFTTKNVEDFSQEIENIIGPIWHNWGSEQVTSNYIICNSPRAEILPYPKYVSYHNKPDIRYEDSVFLHFIGTSRFKNNLYVKTARKAIAKLNTKLLPKASIMDTKKFLISSIQNPNYIPVGLISVEGGRGPGQLGWYKFVSKFCKNHIVLDVGCGLGKGIEVLSNEAKMVYGIDLDARLKKNNILIKDIKEIETKSVDTVIAIDAIEHVERDIEFINNLIRIARKQVFVSTPNYTAGRCKWPYHIREYMPHQLIKLFKNKGKVSLYKGTPSGNTVFQIRYFKTYFFFNKLRIFHATSFIARCLNNLIPIKFRIHSKLLLRLLLN